MSAEFYAKAHELTFKGIPFSTATVVRAEKPTSAKPGDKAIVTAEGIMYGWIGGSCAQPTVIKEALKALSERKSRFIRLSTDPRQNTPRAGLLDLPMTCFSGGTLEIYIEPHLPAPRLMVVGSLPVAQALVQLGKAMKYHVIAVDLDLKGVGLPQADETLTEIDEIKTKITPLTYVVIASHGNYDELAIEQIIRSPAEYIALVSSRKRGEAVVQYLREQGFNQNEVSRLKFPAGLDINAVEGEEIALSILAEIVQKRRTAGLLDVQALLPEPVVIAAEAIDPVCGMSVQIEGAKYTAEYNGQKYFFCCPACRKLFNQTPEKYLNQAIANGESSVQ
jgi:xanthine dehydrogenase accessory factor